ncbi:MAG: right-handed parallel beta-helix repeat-containing protein [Verrucomicrobia bacterium]|nr:right-handed parallel beta-helix repeat-containing protein [Verrucomicrobiota bacterium]MBS0637230.1 right-handed parallel beta-helix repeat-containing protein [Verrucomicrobiota bacterium]
MKINYLGIVVALTLSAGLHAERISEELHRIHKKLDAIETLEHTLTKTAPRPISQRDIHKAGGTLTLTCSGDYCVTENICGTIVIGADSVCLDLCCHTLNAHGYDNAIVAEGYQGLKVFDGRIINSSDAAILADDYSSIELFKLVLSDNALDGIRISNSVDLNVHDVDCINDGAGERALWFDTCDNILVNHVNASGYLSTIGAIVQLDSCNAALIQDVNVTNNTKSQAVPTGSFATDASLVNMNSCTGVDLVRVKVNNNIVNTTAVGNRRFTAIGFSFSNSCSMHRCETCNNVDIVGDNGNDLTQFAAVDRMVFIGASDNVVITEHQANNNSCTQPIVAFRIYNNRDSNNTIFDGCQANSNLVQEFAVSLNGGSDFEGYLIQSVGEAVAGCAIRNCQANFNTVVHGGEGRDPLLFNDGDLFGILAEGSCVIEGCQANNNVMGDTPPDTFVLGIAVATTSNVPISNSSADNNSGGETSAGIGIAGIFGIDAMNCTVSNCSGSSNGNYGLLIGSTVDTVSSSTFNLTIVDSVFNQNGNAFSDAAGIFVLPTTLNASNILIKGCDIYDTFSGGSSAAGINVASASNVVIEDCNIFNTTADGTGNGILFDTVNDSKIIRTQVHGNQDSGVQLEGINTNVMILNSIAIDNDKGFSIAAGSTLNHGVIQGNRALGNLSVGFEHAATLPVPFDTAYQNNFAQNNGVNYSISDIIQIVDYSIPTATYTLEPNGASSYPSLANISAS